MSVKMELPKGWSLVKLGDSCDKVIAGGDVPKGNFSLTMTNEYNIPIFANGEKNKGLYGYTSVPKITVPSVTISARGSIGFTEYRNKPFFPIVRLIVLCPLHYLNVQFLKYAIDNCKIINTGTTIPQLTVPTVKELQISLPPLAEQHRIVAKIEELFSSLDKGIESLKTAQAQLKIYRQAVLKWAFEGKLTNENVKDGELPEGWKWEKLGDIATVHIGSTPKRKISEYWNGEINWISSGEVSFCNVYKTKEKISQIGLDNSSCKMHPPGTVVLAMIGEGKTRGQAAILRVNSSHNQNTAAIRLSEEYIPELLYYYFVYSYEKNRGIGSGNNQKALNKERVKNFDIPVSTLLEQSLIISEIEKRLSVCDKLEESITQSLTQAEALRQSILKKAFEGKLVPQDPSDEPASVLLERIRAERATVVANKETTNKRRKKL